MSDDVLIDATEPDPPGPLDPIGAEAPPLEPEVERDADLEPEAPPAPVLQLSLSSLLWALAAGLFLVLRIAPVFLAPVGGVELVHLAGAWEATAGDAGPRFVPTLFAGLSSILLRADASELLPRLAAFLATATVPLALYLLRRELGRAGALLTLVILGIDPPGISLSAAGSALGFDTALTVWLLVLLLRPALVAPRPWLAALAGAAAMLAGPLALPLLAGALGAALLRRQQFAPALAVPAIAGTAVGAAVAGLRFGAGWDGLQIPPLVLFTDSYGDAWSSMSGGWITLIYSLPLVLGGIGACIVPLYRAYRGTPIDRQTGLLLGWAAVAGLWWLTAIGAGSAVPPAAFTLALAFILGPLLVEAIQAMVRADWNLAKYVLPAAGFALLPAVNRLLEWSRLDKGGETRDQLLVAALLGIAVGGIAIIALNRRSAPALLAAGLVLSLFPILPGVAGVTLAGKGEPLPSPVSSEQAADLRQLAVERANAGGGAIYLHPSLVDQATWPFRDAPRLIVASAVGPDAAVAILPAGAPAPAGMAPLAGQWSLTQEVRVPDSSFLLFVRWLTDRHVSSITPTPIAVYLRTAK